MTFGHFRRSLDAPRKPLSTHGAAHRYRIRVMRSSSALLPLKQRNHNLRRRRTATTNAERRDKPKWPHTHTHTHTHAHTHNTASKQKPQTYKAEERQPGTRKPSQGESNTGYGTVPWLLAGLEFNGFDSRQRQTGGVFCEKCVKQ